MKKLLFSLVLLSTVTILNAQAPTDYVARYNLTRGSGVNVANPGNGDLTNDSNFINRNNRFGRANQAIEVNPNFNSTGYTLTGTNNAVTLSFYFRGGVPSIQQRIAQFFDSDGHGFFIQLRPGGGMSIDFRNTTNGSISSSNSFDQAIHNGAWHQITVVIEKQNTTYLLNTYRNGVRESSLSASFNDSSDFLTSNAPFVINGTNRFDRQLDDIAIFDRALSPSEVSELYSYLQTEVIYVDKNATGLNDGSDWANAIVNPLASMLQPTTHKKEYWVAKGIYHANVNDPNSEFTIRGNDVSVYGGFSGNESFLTDRDENLIHTINATIFSADLQENDNGTVANYSDNAAKVLKGESTKLKISDLTVTGGYYDGTATSGEDRFGAGILIATATSEFNLYNTIITGNTAKWAAGLAFTPQVPTGDISLTVDRCKFTNNTAGTAASLYVVPNGGRRTTVKITNSLFSDNETKDLTNYIGTGASAGWIRAFYSNSLVDLNLSNNTFVNNRNIGTGTGDHPVFGLSRTSGQFDLPTTANNIFWGNTRNTTVISRAFGNLSSTPANGMEVINSIDEDNFANIPPGNMINTSNANPQFNSATDFSLTSSSPAINSGDNTRVPTISTRDLAGNDRILSTTVDIGAYEFSGVANTCNTIVNIPDTNFKNALLDHGVGITGSNIGVIDTDGDGEICQTEAQAYTGRILVDNLNIADLTGIEEFTSLSRLFCNSNQLQTIDVSSNTSLINLQCANNQLSALDLTNNTAILVVLASNNQLQSLDVSSNTSLSQLYVDNNQLTDLNVANGNNGSIAVMNAQNNPNLNCIQHDTGFNPTTNSQWQKDSSASWSDNCNAPCIVNIPDIAMKDMLLRNSSINTNGDLEIQCSEAQAFSGILYLNEGSGPLGPEIISDLTGIEAFVNITGLQSRDNLFTTVDISQNTSLTYLDFERTPITNLDLSNNVALQDLRLSSCDLNSLDIGSLTNLVNVYLDNNEMTSLILPNAPNLVWLQLNGNALINNIDFTVYPLLERLYLGQTSGGLTSQMSIIDLSQNPNLNYIYINDLPNLIELNIANGNNSNIITALFKATNLPNLNCIEVSDVTYAQNNWTDIDQGISFSTDCSTLSIDDFTNDPGVSIYPIPTDDKITINSDVKVENVKVYNTIGLKVAEFETNEISLGTLSNGIYFLKITLENGKEGVQRIVKN